MNWEIVTGVASSIIALCAILFSIWQGIQIRKHNIISFRPHLTTWTHNEHVKGTYVVDILNNGLGPALIKKFTIKIDGNEINGEGTEPIDKALKILFSKELYYSSYAYLGENYAMGAKDKCRFLIIQFYGEEIPSSDYVKSKIERADLVVNYESFYGERFTFNTAAYKAQK